MEQKIPLVKDTIDNKDIDRLINWLKTYPRLTKGEVTIELETNWAKWLGTKHAVFVNSGSSANLMMLYALVTAGKLKNNKVVVPSLAWATDMAPVLQLNLQPIVCDINLQNLAVDINHLEEIFIKRIENFVDINSGTWLIQQLIRWWLMIRLEMMGGIISFFIAALVAANTNIIEKIANKQI